MVITMEMSTGQRLDETVSPYGEVYGDEVLNAGWTDVPRIEADRETPVCIRHEPALPDVDAFMARLYASQE